MSETTCHMSISLDGFVAGPDQSLEHPLGLRGRELHHWHLDEPLHDADESARDLLLRPRGAYVMGRNMFGPIRGPWQGDWRGWGGDEPPSHAPVLLDATPRLQEPGQGPEGSSGGAREFVPILALSAIAAGAQGLFLETHPDPDCAPSDGPNMMPLSEMAGLLDRAVDIWDRINR